MFKKPFILTSTFIAATIFSSSAHAESQDFKQVYVFGNSISDTGNVYSLTGNNFPPSPLYFDGRFSDGPVWVDFLAQDSKLGLNPGNFYEFATDPNPDPSMLAEGINFSIGGATTGTTTLGDVPSANPPILFPGVETQINDFLNDVLQGNPISDDSLVLYWAGENDYAAELLMGKTPEQINPQDIVDNVTSHATRLAEQGAKNVVIANLFDLDSVPLGQDLAAGIGFDPAKLNELTVEHNNLLSDEISTLNASFADTTFVTFDINTLLSDIIDNPASFGINLEQGKTPFDSCLDPNSFPNIDPNVQRCANPDQYVYYDNQHFTSAVHKIIADNLYETIEEEMSNNPNITVPEAGNTVGIIGLGLGMLTLLKRKKAHFSK